MSISEDQGRVVATRSFQDDAGGAVIATVFEPGLLAEDKWACRFRIVGIPTDIDELAYGVDALQALMMALEGIRVRLEGCGVALRWLDGERGVLGMAPLIPFGYGLQMQKHLTTLVEEEISRMIAAKATGQPWPPNKT